MSLKNQEQQNEATQDSPLEDESYECNETISDISLEFNQQKRSAECQCACRCRSKAPQTSSHLEKKEKKRLKRKNNKMKLKNKQKEAQEHALITLEQIIKDIYALRINFEDARKQVEECIAIDINRNKFYDFINSIIRNQVEAIRQEIAEDLSVLGSTTEEEQRELIKGLFCRIQAIKDASPQIEKIINLFVSRHFDPQVETPPYQKNLDELTFSFLIKNYLEKSVRNLGMKESFVVLCELIFERQEYAEERELFQLMMNAYNRYDPQDSGSEEYSDSGYDSEEWDEDTARRSINLSLAEDEGEVEGESRSRRRRERRRRAKNDHEQSFESIMRRVQGLRINESERVSCNVEEDWIQDIIKKRDQYVKIIKNTFNQQ